MTEGILANISAGKRNWRNSTLATDTYKESMLCGGRPEETEVFYLSFRRGGRQYVPVDLAQVVRDLVPDVTDADIEEDVAYLNSKGFPVTKAMKDTRKAKLEIVYAVPKGEWVDPREPVLVLRGPQKIVSWLEPLLTGRVMYLLQVGTAAKRAYQDRINLQAKRYGNCDFIGTDEDPWVIFLKTISRVTCEAQKDLTIDAVVGAGFVLDPTGIVVDEQGYYDAVQAQAQKLIDTGVDPSRFFEVGLRAATCMEQHLIALKALKDMGFKLTSNTYGAWLLGLTPVGTLGHEGIMRWGGNDQLAYQKHVDAMPKVIFLLDTNDTMQVGIPTALDFFKRYPDRMDGARPDSGDLEEQFRAFVSGLCALGINPRPWIFEDGLDEAKVAFYEALREELGYPEDVTLYGLGGFFIDRPEFTPYKRGALAMVYKLTWSEAYGATMKFADEDEDGASGKRSIPGVPVTAVFDFANSDDPTGAHFGGDPIIVCQEGCIPEGYKIFGEGDSKWRPETPRHRPVLDKFTEELVNGCTVQRIHAIAAGA